MFRCGPDAEFASSSTKGSGAEAERYACFSRSDKPDSSVAIWIKDCTFQTRPHRTQRVLPNS
jgi:hypothetical protein